VGGSDAGAGVADLQPRGESQMTDRSATTDLRQEFMKQFGDGDWHELEDLEILFSLSRMSPDWRQRLEFHDPLDPDALLGAIERSGIVIERGDVKIDLGAPDEISGKWTEDFVSTAGFRVVIKK
jgi:hypothetical protein